MSSPQPFSIRLFTDSEAHLIPYLAAIHANCITADHAIVTFLPPINHDRLLQFWKDCIAEVRAGTRAILLLFDDSESSDPPVSVGPAAAAPGNPGATSGKTLDGLHLMGVVMLSMPFSETGSFRGWVEKLLVSPKFRRRGGARALMGALEREALSRGKTLLVCPPSTLSNPLRRFYLCDYT